MHIFYSPDIHNGIISLKDEENIHCTKALRHKIGDLIQITDGNGILYTCKIVSTTKKQTLCEITSQEVQPEPIRKICIGIAPTKNISRIEWFVEKAVEIGISEIILFGSDKTERKIVNIERLEKIIYSAGKQSKNYFFPKISFFKNLEIVFKEAENYASKFIAYCGEECEDLAKINTIKENTIVLIGPEGDFSIKEVTKAKENGFSTVSLGSSRLRTETAGLVSLMILKLNQ